MFVLVPPTSKKTPSDTRRYISAPATVAEGPESMVKIGRLRISVTSITPPSPRMIMRGASMPALRKCATDNSSVAMMEWAGCIPVMPVSYKGGMEYCRMLAFTTADRVRMVRP
jgi:hypothetical protein